MIGFKGCNQAVSSYVSKLASTCTAPHLAASAMLVASAAARIAAA